MNVDHISQIVSPWELHSLPYQSDPSTTENWIWRANRSRETPGRLSEFQRGKTQVFVG
jgi:hypothetical protein